MSPEEVEQLRAAAWAEGELFWLLPKYAQQDYQTISQAGERTFVLNCSRRFRKTTICCLLALRAALKARTSSSTAIYVRYIAPTAKMVRQSVQPIMRWILETCPSELRPEYRVTDGAWVFPWGAEITIGGADAGGADTLRGQTTHLAILDEAGYIAELEYLVKSIIRPALLSTRGRMIVASTPPDLFDSYFRELVTQAQVGGYLIQRTIWDTNYPPDEIEKMCRDVGGPESATWHREFLAEFIRDAARTIVPEFQEALHVDRSRNPVPEYFSYLRRYVSWDIGTRDKSVGIFGYYDFPRACLVVCAERILDGRSTTTADIAAATREAEGALWNNLPVARRVADARDDILANDLSVLHGLPFGRPPKGDTTEAMVNELRQWFAQGRIRIDEDCSYLIACLRDGAWNSKRTDWERSEALGHVDGLAALMYLIRIVNTAENPIPENYGLSVSEIARREAFNKYSKALNPAANHPGRPSLTKTFRELTNPPARRALAASAEARAAAWLKNRQEKR